MGDLKVPKGEQTWVGYYNASGERVFLLTSKIGNREWYYLDEVHQDGSLKKLGKAHSPTELEEKYKVNDVILSSNDSKEKQMKTGRKKGAAEKQT